MHESNFSLSPYGAWLVTYLVHSTLLLGGAWVAGRMLSSRPRVRDVLWKTALLGGLVTATAQVGLGGGPLGTQFHLASGDSARSAPPPARAAPPLASPAKTPAAAQSNAEERPDRELEAGLGAEIDLAALVAALESTKETRGAAEPAARPTEATSSAAPVPWASLAIGACFVLAALFCAGFALSWLRLSRRLGDRREITKGPAAQMLSALARRAGVRERIRLTASEAVPVPIALGILRREICLPQRALEELEAEELESLLAHELAHHVRRDPKWRIVVAAVRSAFFFQPLNWLAARRLEACSEELSDDWAVEATERPLALARCLTEVAGWVARPAIGAAVPAMASHHSQLGRRVRRLVDPGRRRESDRGSLRLMALAVAVPVVVFLAAPGASASDAPEEEARFGDSSIFPVPPTMAKGPGAPPAPVEPDAGGSTPPAAEPLEEPEPPEEPEVPEEPEEPQEPEILVLGEDGAEALRWFETARSFAAGGEDGDPAIDLAIDILRQPGGEGVVVELDLPSILRALEDAGKLEGLDSPFEHHFDHDLDHDFDFDFDHPGAAAGAPDPDHARKMREHAERMREHAARMRERAERMREQVKRRWKRKAERMKRRGERIRRRWQRRGKEMQRRWKRRGEKIRRRALEEAYRDLAKERAHRPDSNRARELERALREADRRHQEEIHRILEEYGTPN